MIKILGVLGHGCAVAAGDLVNTGVESQGWEILGSTVGIDLFVNLQDEAIKDGRVLVCLRRDIHVYCGSAAGNKDEQ